MILNSVLENPLEDIKINVNLSEYLGNHNNVELDVTTATKIHNPPHPETFENMKKRVKKHVLKVQKRANSKELIWFITHGLIIKEIASYYGIKSSKQLPYLTCFSLIEKGDIIRAEFLLFKSMLEEKETNYNHSNNFNNSNNSSRFKKLENNLISPKYEYTGRDDISGR